MGLLRTIFVLVLAWAVFRFLDRWWANRARTQSQQRSNGNRSSRRDQEVIINYDPRSTKSAVRDDVGEVVDFEEVEDESK